MACCCNLISEVGDEEGLRIQWDSNREVLGLFLPCDLECLLCIFLKFCAVVIVAITDCDSGSY